MKRIIAITLVMLITLCAVTNAQYFSSNQQQNFGSPPGPDAIHITQVKAITLRDGAYTSHRRVSPVPQLSCVGGSAYKDRYKPAAVQCVNKGSDGNTIQWKCEADMDEKYQFGKLNVACEGYRYSGDEWVLKGSCGLEYELDYTSKGHRKQNNGYNNNRQRSHQQYYDTTNDDTSGSGFFFTIIVILILAALVYKFCIAGTPTATSGYRPSSTTTTTTTTNMYPDANAPPYNPEYTNNHHDTFHNKHDYATRTSSSNSGPGFWSGAAVGAATGFGLGRATAPSTHTYQSSYSHQPSYRSSTRYDNDDDDSTTTRSATGFATTSSR